MVVNYDLRCLIQLGEGAATNSRLSHVYGPISVTIAAVCDGARYRRANSTTNPRPLPRPFSTDFVAQTFRVRRRATVFSGTASRRVLCNARAEN